MVYTYIVGAILFCAGFSMCYLIKEYESKKDNITQPRIDNKEILIQRTKPSLRNPLKTHNVSYERYKARDSDLYEPSTPRKKN